MISSRIIPPISTHTEDYDGSLFWESFSTRQYFMGPQRVFQHDFYGISGWDSRPRDDRGAQWDSAAR